MRLRWTSPAAEDLYGIVRYIQKDNPNAAIEVARVLVGACKNLLRFPRIGRSGRVAGTRELVFPGLPYIIVYKIGDEVVEIVRIYHGSQDRP